MEGMDDLQSRPNELHLILVQISSFKHHRPTKSLVIHISLLQTGENYQNMDNRHELTITDGALQE